MTVMPAWWPFARTLALFTLGLVILGNELMRPEEPRVGWLIAAFTALGVDRLVSWSNGRNGKAGR